MIIKALNDIIRGLFYTKFMASKAAIAKEKKKKALVEKYSEKRAKFLLEGNIEALRKLPRNSSKVRLRNRCMLTGRAKGFVGKFKLSRMVLREKALSGELPGVKKISW